MRLERALTRPIGDGGFNDRAQKARLVTFIRGPVARLTDAARAELEIGGSDALRAALEEVDEVWRRPN